MKKVRKVASSGNRSVIGHERHNIYVGVWNSIKHAIDQGCWLEVIALSESVIADRLEARIAYLGNQSDTARKVRTASQSALCLLTSTSCSENERQLMEQVKKWARLRNSAVHELAKVMDGNAMTWEERWQATKQVAEQGREVARLVSNWVRKTNKPAFSR